jgi:hypothetical protein
MADPIKITIPPYVRNAIRDVGESAYYKYFERFTHGAGEEDAALRIEDWLTVLNAIGFEETKDQSVEVEVTADLGESWARSRSGPGTGSWTAPRTWPASSGRRRSAPCSPRTKATASVATSRPSARFAPSAS